MNNTCKSLSGRFVSLLVFSVSLIILGCAAEKGLRTLFPSESGLSDYTISDNTVTFKNDFIIVEVSPLNSIYSNENQPYIYIMELLDQGFTIFSIKIENLSNEKIMYNPSFTTIIDNRMGYNKPLDYTDIYDLVRDRKDGEMILKRIQGKFYDLATTIIPGESAAKLLIFGRLEEKSSKATLIMQEIYIGTETIELRFPFIFKVYAPSLSL